MKGVYWLYVFKYGIFSKTLDNEPAELFFEEDSHSDCYPGKVLKPILDSKCIVSMKCTTLSIIRILDDLTKGDVKMIEFKETKNSDFKILDDKKIITLTLENQLSLIEVKLENEKIEVEGLDQIEVKGINRREEVSVSMALCSEGKYLMICQLDTSHCSSISVYEIEEKKRFVRKSILDVRGFGFDDFCCLKFVRYCRDCLIFTALVDQEGERKILTLAFNEKKMKIKEILRLRKDVDVDFVHKLVERGDGDIVGISKKSELVMIEYR